MIAREPVSRISMDHWQPYSAYKDSGIEWAGEIPIEWDVKPLKHFVWCLDGKRIPLNSEQRSAMQGEYPYWGANGILDYVNDWLFDEELVLLGEDGAPFFDPLKDVAFRVEGKIWVNNHAHVLRPRKNIDARYLVNVLNTVGYRAFIDGSTRDKLTQRDMNSIPIQYPPLDEQRAIAAFLDRETARIYRLIAAKERLIALLQEKRAALISHAVTKGIDSTVPMKDSGIPSIGGIPAHWQVKRNKQIFREVDERSSTGQEELLTVSHITGVTPRSEKSVNMFMAESLEGYKKCQVNDIAINTMWAWMGALGVVWTEGIVSPSYNVYRLYNGQQFLPRYLDLLYRTSEYVTEINRFSKGVWSSRLRLYPDAFFEMCTLAPPVDEQRRILAFIDRQTRHTDLFLSKLKRSIGLLREYRSALITAAVTGKIDVRG